MEALNIVKWYRQLLNKTFRLNLKPGSCRAFLINEHPGYRFYGGEVGEAKCCLKVSLGFLIKFPDVRSLVFFIDYYCYLC